MGQTRHHGQPISQLVNVDPPFDRLTPFPTFQTFKQFKSLKKQLLGTETFLKSWTQGSV
jgi:hypothetical protein